MIRKRYEWYGRSACPYLPSPACVPNSGQIPRANKLAARLRAEAAEAERIGQYQTPAPTPKPTSNVGTDIDVWQAAGGVVGARLARLDPSAVDPGAKLVLAPNVTSADAIATAFSWKIYDAASPGAALSLGGSSGVVGASSEFLVLPAGFLSHKSSYTFQLTETRGSGASSSSTLELVVRPANPPNGSLAVNVAAANTTVRDLFVLRAENWTTWQDRNDTLYYRRTADDYPLTYRFVYAVGVGGSGDNATTVRPPSHDNTTATVLPLGRRSGGGASSHYGLVVRVVVTSSLGGIGVASREVTVAPPALGNAVAVSSGAVATLQSFIDDDKILRAAVLLNAQATLLNHVVESSDASAAQVTAALSARASLVGYANTVALRSETVDSVEASAVALASLTSRSVPSSLRFTVRRPRPLLETARDCSRWLGMARDGSGWLETARDGSRWLEMARDGSRWPAASAADASVASADASDASADATSSNATSCANASAADANGVAASDGVVALWIRRTSARVPQLLSAAIVIGDARRSLRAVDMKRRACAAAAAARPRPQTAGRAATAT